MADKTSGVAAGPSLFALGAARAQAKSIRRACRALIPLFLLVAATPAAAQTPPSWSARDVFVFGGFLLDFREKTEIFGRNGAILRNCSTAELYCASGSEVRLVLPRRCSDLDTAGWALDGVRTQVLKKESSETASREVASLLPTTVYLLGSDDQPYLVYVYTRALGAEEIFFDGQHQTNLVDLARREGVTGLQPLGRLRYRLVTLDPFGACR